MFVSELRKQKVLFASVDALALVAAAWCALTIHDPSDAMHHRLEANAAGLTLLGLVVLACCILIFRWLDLYRMRGGGWAEMLTVCRANFFAALLAIAVAFLFHLDLSRITTLMVFPLAV